MTSQSLHLSVFQIAVYLTLFVIGFYEFFKRYPLSGFSASNYNSGVSIDLC